MATYSYIVSDQVSGSTGDEFTILIGGVEETYIVGKSAFSDIVYAETQFVVDKLSDPTLTATIGVAPADSDPFSYGSATDPINNFAGVTLTFLAGADTTINATTFTNEAGAFINAGSNISFSVANVENAGTFNLNGSTFKPTATVINSGTFNISGGADVNATFTGAGTININGALAANSAINGTENTINIGVAAAPTTLENVSISGNIMNIKGRVNLNGGVALSAATANYDGGIIYSYNTNTLNFTASNASIFLVSGGLTASTVGGNVGVSGSAEDLTLSGGNTITGEFNLNGRKVTINDAFSVGKFIAKKNDTDGGDVVIQNATVSVGADGMFLGADSTLELTDASFTAGKLLVSNSTGASFTVKKNSANKFSSLNVSNFQGIIALEDGAVLKDSGIQAGGSVAIAAGAAATLMGENTIGSYIDNNGTITLAADGTEAAFLTGNVSKGTIVVAEGAVALSETAPSAWIVKGTVAETVTVDATAITGANDVNLTSGLYLSTEANNVLFVNSSYDYKADGSAIQTDGHILGYNAFADLSSFTYSDTDKGQTPKIAGLTTINLTAGDTYGTGGKGLLYADRDITINGSGTVNLNYNRFYLMTAVDEPYATNVASTTAKTFTIAEGLTLNVGMIKAGDVLDGDNYTGTTPDRTGGVANVVINGTVNGIIYTSAESTVTVNASGKIKNDSKAWSSSNNFRPNGLMKVIGGEGAKAATADYQAEIANVGFLDGGTISLAGTKAKISQIRYERLNGTSATQGLLTPTKAILDLDNTYLETVTDYTGFKDDKAVFFIPGIDAGSNYNDDKVSALEVNLANGSEMVVHADFNPYAWTTVNVGLADAAKDTGSNSLTAASLTNSGTINVYAGSSITTKTGSFSNKKNITVTGNEDNVAATVIDAKKGLANSGMFSITNATVNVTGQEFYNSTGGTLTITKSIVNMTGGFALASYNGSTTVYGSTINGPIRVDGGVFTIGEGTSTLNGTLTGTSANGIVLAGGAILKDSNVQKLASAAIGKFTIASGSKVGFTGSNKLTANISNSGAITVNGTLTANSINGGTIVLDSAFVGSSPNKVLFVDANVTGATFKVKVGDTEYTVNDEYDPEVTGFNFVQGTGADANKYYLVKNPGQETLYVGSGYTGDDKIPGYNTFALLDDIVQARGKDETAVFTKTNKIVFAGNASYANTKKNPSYFTNNDVELSVEARGEGADKNRATIEKDRFYLMHAVKYVKNADDTYSLMDGDKDVTAAGYKAPTFTLVEGSTISGHIILIGDPMDQEDFDKDPQDRTAGVANLVVNGVLNANVKLAPYSTVTVSDTGSLLAPVADGLLIGSYVRQNSTLTVNGAAEGGNTRKTDTQMSLEYLTFTNGGNLELNNTTATLGHIRFYNTAEGSLLPSTAATITLTNTALTSNSTGTHSYMEEEKKTFFLFNPTVKTAADGSGSVVPTEDFDQAVNMNLLDGSSFTAAGLDFNPNANTTVNVLSDSTLTAASITNAGTINVGNAFDDNGTADDESDDIAASKGTLTAGKLTNTGTINAYNDSSLTLGGGSSNDGTINVYGTADKKSTITLTGAFTNDGTYTAGVNVGKFNLTNGEIVGQGWIYNRYQGVMTLINSDLNVETSVYGGELNAENSNFTPKSGDKNLNAQNGSITLVATGTGSSSITANNLRVINAASAIRINDDDDVITTGAAINKTVTEGKYATQVNVNAITNAGTFKAAYADITAETVANSGTFEAVNATITGATAATASLENTGKITLEDSSLTGFASVAAGAGSADNYFNAKGALTLQIGELTGVISVVDDATFTKSAVDGGKFVIADGKTATFNAADDVSNAVSDIEGGAIVVNDTAMTAGAITNSAITVSEGAKLTAGAINTTGTITVAGQLSATSITTTSTTEGAKVTISITAAGAAATTDPIALTVTTETGISKSEITLTVDVTELTAHSYQYVAGAIGEGVTFKVGTATVTDNTEVGNGYIFTTKGGIGAWIEKKGDTTTLKVKSTYVPADEGFGINKFNSVVAALTSVQTDTTSVVIEDAIAAEAMTATLTTSTFSTDATISGEAINVKGAGKNLILGTASGKTLIVNSAINATEGASVVFGYGTLGSVTIGAAVSGYEVQIDGNAAVNAALTASSLLWLRNGKADATDEIADVIAVEANLNASTVLISSGNVTTTTGKTITANSFVVGKLDDDTNKAVSVISNGSVWTFHSNMLAYGDRADALTLNGGSITFEGTVANKINFQDVPQDTVLIENANFTLTLNSGAKLNAKKIDNIGKIIMVDGSATEINATAIVNRASAEVPIPAQKAIINAKNITAGSIENYGTIGNLAVENQKIAKLDVGTLTNKQYGGVFATALEADAIENSGEIVVKTLTITSADGLIDNKAGGKIAQDNEAMTIDAKAINNDGYISTHGGAITATDITNGAYDDETEDGLIWAGSIEASGTITNKGMIEAPTITAAAIENNGGSIIVTNGTISSTNDIKNTGNGTLSLSKATVSAPWIANKTSGSVEASNGSTISASINNEGAFTLSASTLTAGNVYATNATNASFTVSGASTLTITNKFTGTIELVGAALSGSSVCLNGDGEVVVNGAVGTPATTFTGTNTFGNFAVAEAGVLTITAAAENCLVVNGDFTNEGAITIDASALAIEEGELKQIISVFGDVVNTGSFNAGTYQVIIQNDSTEAGANGVYVYNAGGSFDKSTIVVDGTLGDDIKIGDKVNFGGDEYVFGITAFKSADEIVNLTADTTAIKFKTKTTTYGTLNLARTGVTEETAPISVYVTRTDGTGTGNLAVFDDTFITTDVEFKSQNLEFEDLAISDATVTFAETTVSATADSILITDAFVDFEGATTVTGDVTIIDTDSENPRQKARVNFGEETKTNTTSIGGDLTVTDADVDFDDMTLIGGNVIVNGKSEIEFDRDTTVTGTVTLAAGSVIEADQGYTFTANGGTIDGTLLATNKDDENTEGNTTVSLGSISGTGAIYTDINSDLSFLGTYTGTLYIDVTGLQGDAGKTFATRSGETFIIKVTGENVAADPDGRKLFKKYFRYAKTTGLTQIEGACNVITAAGDADILAAVNHSWIGADNETYYADNVIVNGGATNTLYLQGNSPDQFITLKGSYVEGVYGGTYQDETTARGGEDLGGNINITVENATFKKVLVGGDRVNVASGRAEYYREADINLTINGGTFNNYVAAGMIYQGENLSGYAEIDNTNLTITAGTFAANKGVFGGNFATKKTGSVRTTVTGTASVNIVAGKGDIILNSALYVGSYGAGAVGATSLTFTGVQGEEALQFKQIWGGSSSDVIKKGDTELGNGTYEGTVVGKRTLTFTGFTGAIDCNSINGFTDVVVEDSTATLNANVNMSNVSNWVFDMDSTLVGAFTNDFKGDTFVFGALEDAANLAYNFSWNVFENVGDLKGTFGAANSFKSVTLFGETATWNDASAFASTNYTLSLQTIGEGEDATTNMVVAKKVLS